MGFLDFDSEEEKFIEITEDMSFDDFIETDNEDLKNIVYNSVSVVDALSIANEAWKDGAPFDTDIRIIKDIVISDPLRIVQKEPVKINGKEFYCVWAMATVHGKDYGVPIRFHADKDALNDAIFEWSVEQPKNKVSLAGIVIVMKHKEQQLWSGLLEE